MSSNETLIDVNNLSDEEKRQYYRDWKRSGLKALAFCMERHLPFTPFRGWCKQFKKEEQLQNNAFLPVSAPSKIIKDASHDGFSCVTVKQERTAANSMESVGLPVGMKWPNEVQLQMTLTLPQLVGLIRGVCDATKTLR